jgi:5-methylcytosine-specific restriction endonuclease McrA
MNCPVDGCSFESTKTGVSVHTTKTHNIVNTEICDFCRKEFKKCPSKVTETNFCSTDCRDKYRVGENNPNYSERVKTSCANCNDELYLTEYKMKENKRHYCDEKCRNQHWREEKIQSGEDNPMYGGQGSHWRSRSEWLQARSSVVNRDEMCQWCGSTEDLHVHHLIPVFAGGEKYDLDNLCALCSTCHKNVHKRIDGFYSKKIRE